MKTKIRWIQSCPSMFSELKYSHQLNVGYLGMLDWTMFSHLERFIASSPYPYRPALEELLNSLSSLLKRCLPLKLSELARVAVKHSLKEFSKKYVDKLPIFASIKSYLFYEELFTSYCETAKNLS